MENGVWDMWWRQYKFWIAWGLGALLLIMVVVVVIRRAPVPKIGLKSPFQVVGFYQNYSPSSGHPGSEGSFTEHIQKITTISPRWFQVNADGSVTNIGYDSYVTKLAHSHHVTVAPLFTNAGGTSQVLLNAGARHRAINSIMAAIQKDNLDGVNIDFEMLKPSTRSGLSALVQDLARRLSPLHKSLGVSVFPLVGLPSSINGADDYKALGRAANYLVIMTYDHHYSGGTPGPVAPFKWVQANVNAALKQIPAKKIVLAIGMYGYDWVNDGRPGPAKTIPDEVVPSLLHRYGVVPHYNASNSQNWFTYTSATGVGHIVYYMGTRSAQSRVSLALHDHLSGISLWRLGFEQPKFWSVIP